MDVTEQIGSLKCFYNAILKNVYTIDFQLKLAAIINREDHDKEFDTQLDIIEALSTLTEAAMTSGNPRRTLHYCIILSHEINLLKTMVTDYHSKNFKQLQEG